jgi:hypothetical protein
MTPGWTHFVLDGKKVLFKKYIIIFIVDLPVRVRLVVSDSLLRPTLPNPLRLPSRSVSPWKRSARP